jgi:hypothetical protein
MLRLVPDAAATGRVVGRVLLVETGEEASVRSVEELVAFLRERAPVAALGRVTPSPTKEDRP